MMRARRGFTLIELVVVIAMLGIVTSIALARYARYTTEARVAALHGLAGAIRSAVHLVQARYVATGTNSSPVTLADGSSVAVGTSGGSAGIPRSTNAGIPRAVSIDTTAFRYSPGGATGTYNLRPTIANCNVRYEGATGTVTLTTSGC